MNFTIAELPYFDTFDEWLSYGAELRQERDRQSFLLGRVAYHICVERPKGGRPEPEDFTTAKFAHMLNEEPSVISELRNNWHFWNSRLDEIPANASWRHCAECRRRSGWRPGEPITPKHRDIAMAFLLAKTDKAEPLPKDPRPSWRRRLDRACELLAGIAADPETPALVALAIRTLVRQVTQDKETA